MTGAPNAADGDDARREPARQAAVDAMRLDASVDTAVDDIARMAADLFQAPVALVSVIDRDPQWFKSRVGTEVTETPREWAFCAHAIRDPGQVMVVEDATADPRFAANPLVTGDPNIRFYAGAPLVTDDGQAIGTVCVLDVKPRRVDPELLERLQFMARQVMTTLHQKRDPGRS